MLSIWTRQTFCCLVTSEAIHYFCHNYDFYLQISSNFAFLLKYVICKVNSSADNNILNKSKLKASADNKINATKKYIICLHKGRKTLVAKGENACNQHFLLFP